MPFVVQTNIDGHTVSVAIEAAKEAFAKAIEWQVVGKLRDVSISDGNKNFSISEFSSVMALEEIARIAEREAKAGS